MKTWSTAKCASQWELRDLMLSKANVSQRTKRAFLAKQVELEKHRECWPRPPKVVPSISPTKPKEKPMGKKANRAAAAALSVAGTLAGRANTSVPTAEPAASTGTLARLGANFGTIGQVIGTIGDSLLSGSSASTGSGTGTGRAVTSVDVFTRQPGAVASAWDRLTGGGTRRPSTARVKRLVRLVGVSRAAEIMGVADADVAEIAIRPYRRRGISAASLRTTRRTIRQVCNIYHAFSQIKPRTRKVCR